MKSEEAQKVEVGQDVDTESFANLLIDSGSDLKCNNAGLTSAEVSINVEAEEFITYEYTVSLTATREAKFNKLFDDLTQNYS